VLSGPHESVKNVYQNVVDKYHVIDSVPHTEQGHQVT
jgi:hypothetical protein